MAFEMNRKKKNHTYLSDLHKYWWTWGATIAAELEMYRAKFSKLPVRCSYFSNQEGSG